MEPAGEEQEHNMRQLLPSRVFEEVKAEIVLKGAKRPITAKSTETPSQFSSVFRNTCFSILTSFHFAQKPYVSSPKVEKTHVSENTSPDLVKWTHFLVSPK